MKKFIRSLILVLAIGIALPGMQSCKKYEEGPAFSLRTKKARLANTWKIDKYTINGIDATSFIGTATYEFKKDGTITINYGFFSSTGKWEFVDGKEAVKITIDGDTETWTIMKLKNDEFNFEYTDDDNNKHRGEFISA